MNKFLVLALGVVLLLPGCGDRDAGHSNNLILITPATQRVDFLGSYGYPESVSPHLDRLIDQAIVFEHAYATAPFTGQHPSTHGAIPDKFGKKA